ncbi:MAG: TerB family tellurite resistance protein [Bacteroidota bacterium]
MGKFTKWIAGGLGWAFFGPLGGLLGFLIGSAFDENGIPKFQGIPGRTTPGDFAMSLLVLVSAVMKADGKVLKSELDFVKVYFVRTFGESSANEAIMLLRDLLKRDVDLQAVSQQIKSRLDYSSRLQMMHFLYGIANADGVIGPAEKNVLQRIANYLGISTKDRESILSMFVPSTDAAYKILEISPDASDEEVKKAYRKMAMKYHPDKVSYLGDDFKKVAHEKFQKVSEAYESISKERGIK